MTAQKTKNSSEENGETSTSELELKERVYEVSSSLEERTNELKVALSDKNKLIELSNKLRADLLVLSKGHKDRSICHDNMENERTQCPQNAGTMRTNHHIWNEEHIKEALSSRSIGKTVKKKQV